MFKMRNLSCGYAVHMVARSCRAYSDSAGTTFYNSQAGRWMTTPGALGLRVHDLFSSVAGVPAILALRPANLSSFQWPLSPGNASSLGSSSDRPLNLVVPVGNSADVHTLKARTGASYHPLVSLDLMGLNDERLNRARDLVKECARAGMPPRVLLQRAWSCDCDDPDENLHAESLYEATLTLTDAEAAVITLSDCMGMASEDSLRDAIEAVFNIDCAGESMMERIALRLPSVELCTGALRLGVTRFDATACPTWTAAAADARGKDHPCKGDAPGGQVGCACRRAGVGQVVSMQQLLEAAEEQGIKHSMDVAALKAAGPKLLKTF